MLVLKVEQRHQGWAVPAPISVVRYIDDPQWLWRDEESKEVPRLRPREANVVSKATAVRDSADYKKHKALQVVPLRVKRASEEM